MNFHPTTYQTKWIPKYHFIHHDTNLQLIITTTYSLGATREIGKMYIEASAGDINSAIEMFLEGQNASNSNSNHVKWDFYWYFFLSHQSIRFLPTIKSFWLSNHILILTFVTK